mmetsp:Transcript_27997/g.63318  ORF Transcript_27997/g.63318 Transcript_27997/m.63318 type:complete len:330 (+) Transcript_27997:494-1483(+)
MVHDDVRHCWNRNWSGVLRCWGADPASGIQSICCKGLSDFRRAIADFDQPRLLSLGHPCLDVLHDRWDLDGSRRVQAGATTDDSLLLLPDFREDGVWMVGGSGGHSFSLHHLVCDQHQHGSRSDPDQHRAQLAFRSEPEHWCECDPDSSDDRSRRHLGPCWAAQGSESAIDHLLLCDVKSVVHGSACGRHQVPPQPLLSVDRVSHPHLHRPRIAHGRVCAAGDHSGQEVWAADLDGLVDDLLLELVGILVAVRGDVHCQDIQGPNHQRSDQRLADWTCALYHGLVRSVWRSRVENGKTGDPRWVLRPLQDRQGQHRLLLRLLLVCHVRQ